MAGETAKTRVVLPKNVRPTHYDLKFVPELTPKNGEPPIFNGTASIFLEVVQPTDAIVMNANELTVDSCTLCEGDKCVRAEISYDKDAQTVTFKLASKLEKGRYQLESQFHGVLNDKMMGFYRSDYKDPTDREKTKIMAVTQFEATDARMAFPCFDEPNIKATFDVTLVAPASCDTLSNMPIAEEHLEEDGDRKTVKFERSPVMSTYLLAFIVGEFDYLETATAEGVTVRVYTQKGSGELGRFALECCSKTLSYFSSFFEIDYPLPKLDLIAIPDFSAGAMENWGLVTFRETALLLDPVQSSAQAKSRVAEVVAHELAHQWFGNLVTMDWWTHLWLNEGFATWAADLAADHLFPQWQVWVQFVSTTQAGALRLDGLRSSHAIEVEVNNASEVNEIFDAISYLKGASVIRMLANYLGVATFKRGLISYLNHFRYANASTDDLWDHLEHASGKPIRDLMGNWTRQVGYPVLHVEEAEEGALKVSQSRFLSNGSSDDSNPQWIVPVGVLLPDDTQQYRLLREPSSELGELDTRSHAWVKLNALQSGVFRVSYPDSMIEKLSKAVRSKKLGPEDRLSLLMDSVALAKAGKSETVKALELMCAFEDETEYTCMVDLCGSLSELYGLFGVANAESARRFERLAAKLLRPLSQKLGWDGRGNEPHVQSLLRSLLLGSLVEYEDKETIEEAVRRFEKHVNDGVPLPADLRLVCYTAAVKSRGESAYRQVLKLYHDTELNEEQVRCIRALGAIKDEAMLRRTLEWGYKEVKAQDLFYVFFTVSRNWLARDLAWEFLKEHWQPLMDRFGKASSFATRFLDSCTKSFYTVEKADEVERFFETAEKSGVIRKLEQCLESIRLRAAWLQRDGDAVAKWLEGV